MPRWVRWLQPLLSGVFTVDNLDYVRRDAYLTGVAVGPVDVERLRRYAFISERGLTLFEPGLPALEMFLTSRRFIYQQVYFHRTVRAIDLDLDRGLRAVRPGDLRRRLAGRPAGGLRRPRRVRAPPPGGTLGARRGDRRVADAGRRHGHAGRRGRVAGDPAAPADVALRGRDPSGVRARRQARGPRREPGHGRSGAGGDRPRRSGRSTCRRCGDRRPARAGDARRERGAHLGGAGIHPGVLAHRPALSAAVMTNPGRRRSTRAAATA